MTIRQFIRGIVQLAREGNELFQLQENVVYLQSVGGGFTYFPGPGQAEFWSVAAHPNGPEGVCRLEQGRTLTEAVANLKKAVDLYKAEREKLNVN